MRAFFETIKNFTTNCLSNPLDALRLTDNWWISNFFNFILAAIGLALLIYWLRQLHLNKDEA